MITSLLIPFPHVGMASSPEMNNKMNNKVDNSGTPKPEPKSKVHKIYQEYLWNICRWILNIRTFDLFFLRHITEVQLFHDYKRKDNTPVRAGTRARQEDLGWPLFVFCWGESYGHDQPASCGAQTTWPVSTVHVG